MGKKVAIFAFNGELMCFAHVLLNALDMQEKDYDVRVILEGRATRLIKDLTKPDTPFADLYEKVKQAGLIDCVCRACAAKMESLEEAKSQELPLCQEMSGHPGMAKYIEQGYQVIAM